MSATTDAIIAPSTVEEWQTIANELAAEVTRLHDEIDRLRGGEHKVPLISRADWTHPLYPLWIEMGLDDIAVLQEAWRAVFVRRQCLKCEGALAEHVVDADALGGCLDCGLLYYVRDGHFGIDTIERAQERGPDA